MAASTNFLFASNTLADVALYRSSKEMSVTVCMHDEALLRNTSASTVSSSWRNASKGENN
jgi:hypothetical protein